MVFDECPFCHKLFAVEQVSKEQIDSNIVTPTISAPRIAAGRFTPNPPRPDDVDSEDFITYKVLYRCKQCGKEWGKLSEKEVGIPHSYVEAEGEKSEADADREEEMAREEDYARAEE